jgi:proton glutamate symport protein
MDMGRTGLNVVGNCMAAAVVARWEGEWTPAACSASEAERASSPPHSLRG